MNARFWGRVALGAAVGAVGYLAVRSVRVAADGGRRSYLGAVTIYRPPAEVYAFWRDLPNLGRSLGRVVRVDEIDDQRSRWVVEGPGSSEVDFIVELLADEPQRLLAWRADGAPVPHEGRVEFTPAPGDRGTEVRLYVTFTPSGATAVGPLSGDRVGRLLSDALRRVKQIIEAGEAITAEGRSSGRDAYDRLPAPDDAGSARLTPRPDPEPSPMPWPATGGPA
ncbi:SRPBCC family protein [Planosporangium mesophilum]|uniref:SRPBCC family protein n=1 Tax=Planosporangium mesophilum TaxID=689768 RepID=UPI001438B72D|nr:SRPBCC family protein [Planosporangium mesophilum]NJC81903.1 SRPBCC family protein [Planosporangium mesophilum]